MDEHPYDRLSPELILEAVETSGLITSGQMLELNSYENRVIQIGIDEHPGIVAKFYRPYRWSNECILEEHEFSEALSDSDIPVIAPLRFNDHSLLEHESFRFAIFPRRGGRSPDLDNLDQLEWIGRLLGRIHKLGSEAPFTHRPDISVQRLGRDAQQAVLKSAQCPMEYKQRYESISNQLIDTCELLFDEIKPISIRLHGDCHPGNILWTDAGPHFVDMDDCANGPAIQDLWMLITGDDHEKLIQWETLLEGYETFHQFDRRELRLIEALRSLRQLHYTAWLTQRWQDPAFPRAFPWFEERSYWEGYLADLTQQLEKLLNAEVPQLGGNF